VIQTNGDAAMAQGTWPEENPVTGKANLLVTHPPDNPTNPTRTALPP
jgi:hypothetical protein